MSRRSTPPTTPRRSAQVRGTTSQRDVVVRLLALLVLAALVITIMIWVWAHDDSARLASRADAAAKAGNWSDALKHWEAINQTKQATAHSLLEEARACLALNRAAQAERALIRATGAGPTDPAPWLLRLRILHMENRTLEAQHVGWAAYSSVPPLARRDILQALTLALLTDPPDDFARDQLNRWISADPTDVDAQVALLSRIADQPRGGDPDRNTRIATLTSLLERHPDDPPTREALIIAFVDAGELDRGREVLDAWPAQTRDARYYRLRGRWDLEYEQQPEEAVRAFRRALTDQPHDWRTHYRLSRALSMLGQAEEAHDEAESVSRLREILEPDNLGRRLVADFDHLDERKSRLDLATLCDSVSLERLADAWRIEGAAQAPLTTDSFGQGLGIPPLPSRPR
jgi:tetratricopeptide (TPR) repeat protein